MKFFSTPFPQKLMQTNRLSGVEISGDIGIIQKKKRQTVELNDENT